MVEADPCGAIHRVSMTLSTGSPRWRQAVLHALSLLLGEPRPAVEVVAAMTIGALILPDATSSLMMRPKRARSP